MDRINSNQAQTVLNPVRPIYPGKNRFYATM